MKRLLLTLLGALALLVPHAPARAQVVYAQTVSACGTPNNTPVTGNTYPMTMDATGKLCTSASGGGGGGGAVFGPTAVGSAAANPPVLTGGTANGLATGTVQVNKVDSGGDQFVNLAEISGAAPSLTNPIWIANAEAADVTGTFTNATQTTSVTNTNADGYATALISINGTYGTASGVFEESDDAGTTYYSIICTRSDGTATETGYTTLTNTNRQWSCPVAGNDTVRVRSTAVASGTVNVRVGISAPPNSSGVISGSVTVSQATAANLNMTDVSDVAQASTTSGQVGPLIQGAVTTSNPSYSNGQTSPIDMNPQGSIRVIFGGGGAVGSIGGSVAGAVSAANGWTPQKVNALTNTAVAVKTGAGQMGMLQCWNPNASVAYIQVYNVASGSVTVGTTASALSIGIAPTQTGGWALSFPGMQFSTAMSLAATTTATGGTAPGTAVDCNLAWN